MCTVTYLPLHDRFLMASNRDENRQRPAADMPAMHILHHRNLLYPRDGLAGGSWIGVSDLGYAVILLNGAFEKHESRPPYRRSRGLVMLDVLSASHPAQAFRDAELSGVEPFTLVIAGQGTLATARWNGVEKSLSFPDARSPHIWSSVTLYPQPVRQRREAWFTEWLARHPAPEARDLESFHRFTGGGDPENDLRMERSNGIFTNSVSVLDSSATAVRFHYLDLRNGLSSFSELSFVTTPSHSR